MTEFSEITVAHDVSEADKVNRRNLRAALANHVSLSSVPIGLAATSDGQVRRTLAEVLIECGLMVVPVATVANGRRVLARKELSIVLWDDHLADGECEDILETTGTEVPVIVVSRTGDWLEYLKAIGAGAFEYLAYPPIP